MALFLIKTPDDPNVHYHGHTLPRDKAPAAVPVQDPTVNYAGKQLPRDGKAPNIAPPDPSNNPSLVVIGGITLPPDVVVLLNGHKILAQSRILDGVSVIEHVGREPYKLEFEATFRISNDNGVSYIFPQDALDDLWTSIWLPNSIQIIQNTYLNKLGIQQIVIEDINPVTIRGSKNVPFRMKALENVIGQTLISTPQ